jgi:hypothetical protein
MSGLQKHKWDTVRTQIGVIDPVFAEIIDELSPPADHALYIAEYPYGDLILNKGIFQVRNADNALVPLAHHSIDSKTQEDLGYTGVHPFGIVVENSVETFFTFDNQTLPSSFSTSGDSISLWSVLEGTNSYQVSKLWNISSGARTICMLPRITDKVCYAGLRRKYNLRRHIPVKLSDHWKVFANLANSEGFSEVWKSKIVYFSKEWFQHKNDKKWSRFNGVLLQKAWDDSAVKRNQFIADFAFSSIQKKRGLKPNPYLVDTAKHLVNIGLGGAPGFKPATNSIAAPILGLQQVYIEDYGLKKLPIIMQLQHFSEHSLDRVYYSLEIPTTPIFSPRSSNGVSRMVDMRELKYLLDTVLSEIQSGHLMLEKTPLFALAQNVKYNFYHVDVDQYNEITQVATVADVDPNFKKIVYPNTAELSFSDAAPFFTGCIALSRE